jgi:hypothetical protein
MKFPVVLNCLKHCLLCRGYIFCTDISAVNFNLKISPMTDEMQMFLHLLYPPAFQLFAEIILSENHVSVMNTLTIVIFHLKVPK